MLTKISLSRILAILIKEFIHLKRDITTLKIMVGIPLMQLILFGFAINSEPRYLRTALVLGEDGPITRSIISGLKNSSYFDMRYFMNDEKEALSFLQKGKVTFVITIPNEFEKKMIRGFIPEILIQADASDPIAIGGPLSSIHDIFKSSLKTIDQGMLRGIPQEKTAYDLKIHKLYNPEGISRYNIVPGLIAIVLTSTCVMMTALSLTKEREKGTMENLLSMPVKPIEVMIGKIAPYVVIGYIQSGIILLAAFFIFKIPFIGNIFLLALSLLIYILCNLCLGFTLSAAAKNQMQAMQTSMFLILPSILLSGFMFPFRGMPIWAQTLGSILPSTYFIRIVRSVMLKGGTFIEILPHIWPLLIFLIVVTYLAINVYKTNLD